MQYGVRVLVPLVIAATVLAFCVASVGATISLLPRKTTRTPSMYKSIGGPHPYRLTWVPRWCDIQPIGEFTGFVMPSDLRTGDGTVVVAIKDDQSMFYYGYGVESGWPFRSVFANYETVGGEYEEAKGWQHVIAIPWRGAEDGRVRVPVGIYWSRHALNTACFAAVVFVGISLIRWLRRRLRCQRGVCAQCGHQLIMDAVCQECGFVRSRGAPP